MMGWFLFLLILLSFFRVLFIIYNDFFVSLKNWIWGGVGGARFINHCFMKASSPYKKKAYWLPIIWANSYRLATFQPCSGFSRKFRMFVLKLSTFQGTEARITPIKSYIWYISKSAHYVIFSQSHFISEPTEKHQVKSSLIHLFITSW